MRIKIYNIIVLSVKVILIIIHQNIHSDSLPPPPLFFFWGNTGIMMIFVLSDSPLIRGLFTSDLTHLDDGNDTFTPDNLINFTKCRLIYNRIRDFMLHQVSKNFM